MEINEFLPCLLEILGRSAIPPSQVRRIIGDGSKQLKAFNLCDGSNSLTDIAKKAQLDAGNLSRTLARWREHGIVFLIESAKGARYLRIYPLAKGDPAVGSE